jgi:hypothetical protein
LLVEHFPEKVILTYMVRSSLYDPIDVAGLRTNLEGYSWTNERPVLAHCLVTLRSNSVAASTGGAFG